MMFIMIIGRSLFLNRNRSSFDLRPDCLFNSINLIKIIFFLVEFIKRKLKDNQLIGSTLQRA